MLTCFYVSLLILGGGYIALTFIVGELDPADHDRAVLRLQRAHFHRAASTLAKPPWEHGGIVTGYNMKKRLLSLAAALLVLPLMVAGCSVAVLGETRGQPENPLAGRVLQRSDLPEDSEAYYAEQLTAHRFPGSPSPVNAPLQVEGFQDGYVAGGWYPFALEDGGLQDKLERKQAGAYVLSVVYQYQHEIQAATALQRQLDWFRQEGNMAVDAKARQVGYDESLAAANGVHGRAMEVTYSQEGLTWVSYWFFGVEGDTLMLLWVDGLPDPGTHEVLDLLVSTLVQRSE